MHRIPLPFTSDPAIRRRRRRRKPDIGPLQRIPALAGAEPRQLAKMVPHTTCLRLPAGRALVRAGEVARELIVILSGEAMTDGPGDRLVTLGPGTEIGGREALRHERHATTVVAATALDVVVVSGPSLRWAQATGVARLAPAATLAPVIPMPPVERRAEPAPTAPALHITG